MNKKFTLLVLFIATFFAVNAQQLPNAGFDSWTIDTLAPDGWATYESLFGMAMGHAEKDAVDKVYGPYSLKITSDSLPGADMDTVLAKYGVLAGVVGLGKGNLGLQGPAFSGIAFPYRPDTLFCLYKFTSTALDSARISLGFKKNSTSALLGGAPSRTFLLDTSSQWKLGYSVLSSAYLNSTIVPDTVSVRIYASKNPAPNGGVKGSVLHVDNLLFGYVTLPNALQEIADKLNITIYPNPATNLITISTDENPVGFRAVISDISGRIVSVNNLGGKKTIISLSELSNGTYIYRIADKTGNILKQDRFCVVK